MSAVDFNAAVLERSRTVPVVVDFWADWCGPCRTLGPIIEDLAAQAEGRWELVKVDIEAQPEVATDYGVMSIPAVKMFHDGKVVGEFVGALPAGAIRDWLERTLPDPAAERLRSIEARWVERGAEVVPELERFVAEHPDADAGRAALALALVTLDAARSAELVGALPDDGPLGELKDDVASLARLMQPAAGVPDKVAPHLAAAREALAAHDLDRTLGRLVDAAMADPRYDDELARRAAVALFRRLGHDHPLTHEHRRRLAMALNV